MKEIYSNLVVEGKGQNALDDIVVIRKIPKADENYSKTWIVENIFNLLKKHQAIVLDVDKDVQVMDDEEAPEKFFTIILFLDGFSHLRDNDHELEDEDDDEAKLLKLLHSETDDEAEDKPEGEEAKEEVKKPKDEGPQEWACSICTLVNPVSISTCDICGQG